MPHADPDVRAAYLRDWKQANRGRYADRQKATDAARHANERAAAKGTPGTLTIDQAAEVLARRRCHWCGTTEVRTWWTIDHVIALGEPGSVNGPENIVCSCHPCNSSKRKGERPGRWALNHDACVGCGTTARRHRAHGLCSACHQTPRRPNPAQPNPATVPSVTDPEEPAR